MKSTVLIFLTLLSCAEQTLAMDQPLTYGDAQAGEHGFSVQNTKKNNQKSYLKAHQRALSARLEDLKLRDLTWFYGQERVLTAFFVTGFAYIRALYDYPIKCADHFEGANKDISKDKNPPTYPIEYAHAVFGWLLGEYFDLSELNKSIEAAYAIYKKYAKLRLGEAANVYGHRQDAKRINDQIFEDFLEINLEKEIFAHKHQSDNKWNESFCHFEGSLINHLSHNFLPLFDEAFIPALKNLPENLSKTPFAENEKRKQIRERLQITKPENEYFIGPWINYMHEFFCNIEQDNYRRNIFTFFEIKYDKENMFYLKDVFVIMVSTMNKIWYEIGHPRAEHKTLAPVAAIAEPKIVPLSPSVEEVKPEEQAPAIIAPTPTAKKKKKRTLTRFFSSAHFPHFKK